MYAPADLLADWRAEEQAPFTGWDFSHLAERMHEEDPPWSYPARAGELLPRAHAALDIGTGGGERLLALRAQWPPVLVATEDYPPNVLLSASRLAEQGGYVVAAPADAAHALPFRAGAFDVVLNRHAGLNPREIARVLAPGGIFYTQQVHALWAQDLTALFGALPEWPDSTPEKYVPELQAAGLTVTQAQEWRGRLSFSDVGAIVYYLRAVPWLVPGFSVDRHLGTLLDLHARLQGSDPLAFAARLYVIEAAKPNVT